MRKRKKSKTNNGPVEIIEITEVIQPVIKPEKKEKQPLFWNLLMGKLLENDIHQQLKEMGNTDSAIYKFQKTRFVMMIACFMIGLALISSIGSVAILLAFGLSAFIWFAKHRSVKQMYLRFTFKKQLNFSKFMRLMVPYLLQEQRSLYSIFNSMHGRLDDPYIRSNLEILMIEINDNPNEVKAFEQFALVCSGTETASLFMSTLFDYQQSSFDVSVIKELGEIASEELFTIIDSIIAFKLKRFGMFPTKITFGSFVLTIGFVVAMILSMVKILNF